MSFSVLTEKTEYKATLEDFARVHYRIDGYNGFVHLCVKKNDGSWRSIGAQYATEIGTRISTEWYRKRDYYITANATKHATERNLEDVYTLHNIVVDVDWHDDEGCRYTLDEMIDIISEYRDDDDTELPMPNTIVFSGRGYQLWFAINPLSYRAMHAYVRARNNIIDIIMNIPEFKGKDDGAKVGVDTAPSKNSAGVFRLPGSWNQEAKCYGEFRILHDEPLDVDDYLNANALREKRKQRVPSIAPGSGVSINTSLERERALRQLVMLRQAHGTVTGQRDMFLFCVHCIWSHLADSEDIMSHVRAFNQLFSDPLTDAEVEGYMSTANEKRYQATNATIIDRLEITEAEQDRICFYTNKRAQERAVARQKKAERDAKILQMYTDGASVVDIASAVGCSRPTVYSVLGKQTVREESQNTDLSPCKENATYNRSITAPPLVDTVSPSALVKSRSALLKEVTSSPSGSAGARAQRAGG